MTTLLKHHIETLHLKPDSGFPSEIEDAHQLVREWRRAQRRLDPPVCRRSTDDPDFNPLVGEQE
jgi:hypothetical protein